jgi:hypothetical protein
MKYLYYFSLILTPFFSSCGESDTEDSKVVTDNQTDNITIEENIEPIITIDGEDYPVDSTECKRYDWLGHPMMEASFFISSGYGNKEDLTVVKVDVTAAEGKHLFNAPLGDTTTAIISLIVRDKHVKEYYKPVLNNDECQGWVDFGKIKDKTFDISFGCTIQEFTSGKENHRLIEVSGKFINLDYIKTNSFGREIKS